MADTNPPTMNGTPHTPQSTPSPSVPTPDAHTNSRPTITTTGTTTTNQPPPPTSPDPSAPRTTPAFTPTRRLRICTIGAGYSGMILAHKLQYTHAPTLSAHISHTIYESRPGPGGTWLANTYPGVQCDVPAHIYTFPFAPSPSWERFYASGGEVLEYFRRTVREWGLDRDVRYNTTVEGATWSEDRASWEVRLFCADRAPQRWSEEYDVLVSARGILSTWRWPEIKGLEEFKGKKVHSAAWDHGFEYAGKRIAMVGNGSSAIQILPALAKLDGTRVISFQRSPTWVVNRHAPAKLVGSDDPSANPVYREEDKRRFEDKEELRAYRRKIVGNVNRGFRVFVKGSKEQVGLTEFAERQMREKLGHDERLCDLLIPKNWPVGCRRVTPGEGYLEAFTRDNVEVTMEGIERVDEKGVWTKGGKYWECDVLVCATGFDVSQRPTFPVVGRGGWELGEMWKGEAESYMVSMVNFNSQCTQLTRGAVRCGAAYAELLPLHRSKVSQSFSIPREHQLRSASTLRAVLCWLCPSASKANTHPHPPLPNPTPSSHRTLTNPPSATVGHGSLIYSLSWAAEWMIKWLHKILADDIASVTPKQEAVDDFVCYGDKVMQRFVWTSGCRSWYKNNRVDGRVTATFAGSALLFKQLMEELRPEDFEIRYRNENRFEFLGNGFMEYELDDEANLAWYVEN